MLRAVLRNRGTELNPNTLDPLYLSTEGLVNWSQSDLITTQDQDEDGVKGQLSHLICAALVGQTVKVSVGEFSVCLFVQASRLGAASIYGETHHDSCSTCSQSRGSCPPCALNPLLHPPLQSRTITLCLQHYSNGSAPYQPTGLFCSELNLNRDKTLL